MKNKTWADTLSTPLGLVFVLAALIAIVELLIMLVVEDILVPAVVTKAAWNYVDAALLTLILVPAMYFLVFQRMQKDSVERKRNLIEIQASENRFRALIDTISDGVIVIDTKGRIQTFNPAATILFGHAQEEVLGKNISMLMPNPYVSTHDSYLQNYLSTGIQKMIGIGRETIGQRKDSSTFPMELAVSELKVDGELLFIGIVRDITMRKRVEAEIIAAKDQAEKANLIKSQFLSRMSHELRTPLNAIMGFSQLIKMDSLSSGDDDALEYVHNIMNAGESLLSLINDVLDFAQLEVGKLRIEPSQTNLLKVAIDSIGAVRLLAEARKIEVRLNNQLLENLGELWVDPVRTKQVVLNLLSNAIKYNKEGGSIDVTLETVNAEFTRLSVIDSGIGIREKDLGVLFLPFSRLHANNQFVEGAGIGLSITKDLVEKMGGCIGVKSVKDEGSTFWIDMPAFTGQAHT